MFFYLSSSIQLTNPSQQNFMIEKQHDQHHKNESYSDITSINYYLSQQIAQSIVKDILDRWQKQLDEKEAFKETLKKFSKTKIIQNMEEVNKLHLLYQNKVKTVSPAGSEPLPLIIDSLLPKSADIDPQNLYKKNLKNMISFTQTQISQRKKKIQKQVQEILYHKLDLKEQNQNDDGFTKQLRKMQEEKVMKAKAIAKAKLAEQNLLNAKLKEKKKERQEPTSYDYNGSQIKLRPEYKNNLISKLIKDTLNNNTKTVKEAFNDKNPTTVDGSLVKNMKKNSSSVLKIKQDVRFNQNRSLSEGISVNGGIKYTYQGKTLQGKTKSLSTLELKKNMHQRMLSKEQFQKVRSLNGSHIQLNIYSDIDKQMSQRLSKSQMYSSDKKKKVKERREKIIVSNQILKKKLLQKVQDNQEPKLQLPNPEAQKLSISDIDIFNMNYLKSGGNPKQQKQKKFDKSTKASSFSLPKIYHTNANGNTMPKERQKLKETKSIFFQLRKRFEDKLRL